MDYRRHYIRLIRKARLRIIEGYTEKHHVFPRSIFGDNKTIVKLTAREHFIAHVLLWKYYKTRYGHKHKNTVCMVLALNGMIYGQNFNRHVNSRLFESLRKEAAKAISVKNRGIPKSQSHRENIRLSKMGNKNPAYGKCGINSPSYGCKRTEEQRKKISEIRRSLNNPLRNRPRSEQDKLKIKNSCRFKMKPIERIDKKTGEVTEYESIQSVKKDGFYVSHVHSCLNRKRVSHKGYYWNYL